MFLPRGSGVCLWLLLLPEEPAFCGEDTRDGGFYGARQAHIIWPGVRFYAAPLDPHRGSREAMPSLF